MTTHDLADPSNVWWTTDPNDLGDLLEVARAQEVGADYRLEASIVVAPVVERVDDAALNKRDSPGRLGISADEVAPMREGGAMR